MGGLGTRRSRRDGWVAVAESVPYILVGIFGRRLIDRCAHLRAMALIDVTRAALVAALPLAWAFGGITGLIVVAGLLGFGGAFFDPNLGSMTPDLVKPEDVPTVVALMDLTGRIARVAGPGTAGALLTLVSASILFFWIDATTFILSALALLLLPRALAGTGRTVAHQARDVAKTQNTLRARQILREHPRARVMLGMHTVGIVAGAAGFALPALLTTRMDAGPGATGRSWPLWVPVHLVVTWCWETSVSPNPWPWRTA